ncbi:MAG: co-chaperone GroES [Nitrososphaera sp.]|nr:co-chaperone GroES [Nitrososphaera sp.]
MALKPLGDRIVVRQLEPQEKTKSGLVLPDSAREKPQEAKIVAVGPGRLLDEGGVKAPEVKTGDRILYGKYSGTEVTVEGADYLILREEDILAIVQS